ncbi:MAG: glutaredoxin family protein [Alkalimonas sp.]|nr:glutaredoxin family protein [Alkalimonas sp.]
MRTQFELYSTWGCHLCESAEQMLQKARMGGRYQVVDIVDRPDLFERYRTLIPVIACVKTQDTLGWPFEQQQLETWLQYCEAKDVN